MSETPNDNHQEIRGRTRKHLSSIHVSLISIVVSVCMTIFMFILGYFVYGKDELRNIRASIDKTIEETLATKVQQEISKFELAAKKVQKPLEIERDKANTSLIVADFISVVRPTFEVNCKAKVKKSTRQEHQRLNLHYIIINNGRYPFLLDTLFSSDTDTSKFSIIEDSITPSGIVQPGQSVAGGPTLLFHVATIRELGGHMRLALQFDTQTPQAIVDVLVREIKNEADKKSIINSASMYSRSYFNINF